MQNDSFNKNLDVVPNLIVQSTFMSYVHKVTMDTMFALGQLLAIDRLS